MINFKEFRVDKNLLLMAIIRKFRNRNEGIALQKYIYEALQEATSQNNIDYISQGIEKCNDFTNNPEGYKELINNTDILEHLKPIYETSEFIKLYEETLKYRDDVIKRWNQLQPEVRKYFTEILGINEEKDIVVNVVHPDFNTGTNNMIDEIFWGHYKGNEKHVYDVVYMMHESMHCMFPYKKEWNKEQKGICHSLIELATDNELMCRLSENYKNYNEGHPDASAIRKKLMPLWCTFLSEKSGETIQLIQGQDSESQNYNKMYRDKGIHHMNFPELMQYCIEHYREFDIDAYDLQNSEADLERVNTIDKVQENKTIPMKSVVVNAITQGTATEHVVNSYNIENTERQLQ